LYGWPVLRRLSGAPWPTPPRYRLPAAFAFTGRKVGRREYWRGSLMAGSDGVMRVEKFARDGSGLITGLRVADGLIEIPEAHGDVAEGALVDFIPYSAFGIVR
jgi:molybdopterin molybdotransferase